MRETAPNAGPIEAATTPLYHDRHPLWIAPRENLFRYLRGGADLVVASGDKGIRGPQSTGILVGRRDLIRAATLNASPNQAIGRAAKTSKEEIVGLVTALELFLAEDEKTEMERYREVCASIVTGLGEVPGIRAVVEQDPVNRVLPHAVLYFEPSWTGPLGRAVQFALAAAAFARGNGESRYSA